MADIPFALHLLTSASTGGFWGRGRVVFWAGTAFTPEAGTQVGATGTPLPPGSPITTCREDPLMERKD